MKRALALVLALLAAAAWARENMPPRPGGRVFDGLRAEVAFTPGDAAARLIVRAIDSAQRAIYVQAFSFTHRAIADALLAARRRGVDVRIIADARQAASIPTSLVDELAAAGIAVSLDGEHDAAHNKVMILDPGTAAAAVVTGSYNFTHAAEFRNAENVVVLRGNRELSDVYLRNWLAHRAHSRSALESREPAR